MEPNEIEELRSKWEAEISKLAAQRTEIDNKIIGLQTMIKGLRYMEKGIPDSTVRLDPVPLPPHLSKLHSLGLTEAVRLILGDSVGGLRPVQVRDRLTAYGYAKLPKDNPMAAVHGVLRRLENIGDATTYKVDGKTVYSLLVSIDKIQKNALKALYDSGMRGNEKPK